MKQTTSKRQRWIIPFLMTALVAALNLGVVFGETAPRVTSLNVEGSFVEGQPHRINAKGETGGEVLYQFWVMKPGEQRWILLQNYSRESSVSWTPEKRGDYRYGVHIKDVNSTARVDAHLYQDVTITSLPPAELEHFHLNGNRVEGYLQRMVARGKSTNDVLYQFWMMLPGENRWRRVQDYSEKRTYSWVPNQVGNYRIGVHIKDAKSNERVDAFEYQDIEITTLPPAEITHLILDGNGIAEYPQMIRVRAESPNKALYQFWVNKPGENRWIMLRDYDESPTYRWTPEKVGEYRYGVHVKDVDSKARLDHHRYQSVKMIPLPPAELQSLEIEGNITEENPQKIVAKATAANDVLYQFWINDLKENRWRMVRDYGKSNSYTWTPKEPGEYRFGVHVKDEDSKARLDDHQYQNLRIYPGIAYQYTYYDSTFKEAVDRQMLRSPRTDLLQYKGADDPTGGRWYMSNRAGVEYYLNPDNFFNGASRPDEEKYALVIASSGLNVRSGPSTSYPAITQVNTNETYPLIRSENRWHLIDLGGRQGWVSGEYVYIKGAHEKIATESIRVQATSLNIRTEPSTSATIIGSTAQGEIHLITGRTSGWYRIRYEGRHGWVSADWVEEVRMVPRQMYQFFTLSGSTGATLAQLRNELQGRGILSGREAAFQKAGRDHNLNELYLVAHALLESGNGTSRLANGLYVDPSTGSYVPDPTEEEKKSLVKVYNMYGIGAHDSNPLRGGAQTAYRNGWTTPELAVIDGARWIGQSYINHTGYRQDTLYKMRWNPANPGVHQYATDIGWAMKQTRTLDRMFEIALRNNLPIRFNIPVYR